MKTLKSIQLTIVALLCSIPVCAHDFEVDGIYYNITSSDNMTVEVTYNGYSYSGYGKYAGDVVIPESVTNGNTYSVISIGDDAFEECTGLTSITIPNSVTSIGNFAFEGCTGLTSITIPNSVISIGYFAFEGCTGLTSITIPNSVTSIGNEAFSNCLNLANIVVDENNLKYDSRDNCNAIIETATNTLICGCYNTIIPYSVTSIGDNAFKRCTGLTNITIPNSATSIGNGAFSGCSSLTSITIPNSVISIEAYTFASCTSLTSITIPNSVTYIGDNAFYGCKNLKTVINFSDIDIRKSNSSNGFVGYYAAKVINVDEQVGDFFFSTINEAYFLVGYIENEGDKELVLPENYKGENYKIESYAFYDCSSLISVTIPNSVTAIGERAFYGCENLKLVINFSDINIREGSSSNGYVGYYATKVINADEQVGEFFFSTTNGTHSLVGYIGNEGNKELLLPDSYKGENYKIKSFLFSNDTNLVSITIPNSVTGIEYNAFEGCSSLTIVHITDIVAWCNIDFETYDSNPLNFAHHLYLNGEEVKDLVLPNSVTSIRQYAFSGCTSLTSFTIPNSVTNIEQYAFSGCTGLTSITIPNSVASISIYAFSKCENLANVVYEANILDLKLFDGLALMSLTIGAEVKTITNNLRIGKEPIKTIWLTNTPPLGYSKAKGKVNYASNEQYSHNNVIIYPYLSSIFEVNGIKYVPVNMSERTCDAIDCIYDSSIENVTINSTVLYKDIEMTVKEVKPYSFYGNSHLKEMKILNQGGIGESAFHNCNSLESIILGEGANILKKSTFRNTAITKITIPTSVQTIEDECFYDCSNLNEFCISQSVISIGNNVFNNCSALTNVIIEDRATILQFGSNGSSPLFADCPIDSLYIGGKISYNISSDKGFSPFYRNTTLRSVVISDKEESIYDNEFYGCTNLKNVTIGNGVTSIGNWAFSGCSSLDNFAFGKNVKSIGKEAFSDCTNITQIISHAVVPPTCGTQALDDINKWNCTLKVPQCYKAAYQVADQWKDFFFIEDVVNGIDNTILDTEETTAPIYNLQGVQMKESKEHLPAGIYIQGRKKMIIR